MVLGKVFKGGEKCDVETLTNLARVREKLYEELLNLTNGDLSAAEGIPAAKSLIEELRHIDEELYRCAVNLQHPWESDKQSIAKYFPIVTD